ncbi:hypothetical protein BX265_4951 [Streptomyces sp. TLI_235]|nr:hypothetical protein [Streptomyces sp. TLI_235]PBC80115.1 hypothetical protein BX265_4951 [Streptomyces sp. TLI_235]
MALINTQVLLSLSTLLTGAQPLSGQTPQMPVSYQQSLGIGSGTGSGQADKLWVSGARTLAGSANEDLDLAGTLVDALGSTLTLARVKGLIVAAAAANTNDVVVGGAASNGFISWAGSATDKVKVKPGGFLALFAPDATAYPVTGGTADLLRITNGAAGTSVSYDVIVIGSSA